MYMYECRPQGHLLSSGLIIGLLLARGRGGRRGGFLLGGAREHLPGLEGLSLLLENLLGLLLSFSFLLFVCGRGGEGRGGEGRGGEGRFSFEGKGEVR